MKILMTLLLAAGSAAPAAAAPGALTFAVMSDVHCQSGLSRSSEKFAAALADSAGAGAAAAVVAGDSSDGLDADYRAVRSVVSASPLAGAVRFAIGNHEYYAAFHDKTGAWNAASFPNGQTDAAARARFNALRGAAAAAPVYYDEWISGWHFIFLGGESSRVSDPGNYDDADLSDAQLAWLKARLAENGPQEPVFVFLHQPFPCTVAGSCDGAASIKQAAALKALLAAHPGALFFSGHSHYRLGLPSTRYTDDSYKFGMFNCSSVWEPYGADNKPLEGDHSEGYIVKAGPGGVTVLGRDLAGGRYIDGEVYYYPASGKAK